MKKKIPFFSCLLYVMGFCHLLIIVVGCQNEWSPSANGYALFDVTNINTATAATVSSDAPAYNLAGQRVDKAFKGVVIVNGKKMVRK